ncbi:hypothetical protein ACPUVO_05950 [Pseudocolwellia sp. HL-MZ19]|uniref:hypothetical protein n=1 Tax=unclassified Pseudocolwellia TaxID=2848178 RepID=UPI003CF028C3
MRHNSKSIFSMLLLNQKLKTTQTGSSLVIGIFILVIMSLLGAALIEIMESNEDAYTYEVLGTRAYNAAQSGIQIEMQNVFPLIEASGGTPSVCDNNSRDESFTSIDGLSGCLATLQCSSITHESSTTYYTISSIGQCEINGEVTSRTIEVQAKAIN